jgi:CBS domain-containing protein
MSPRAAWRLERLGFKEVYDFSVGKAAWLAMGWPREGTAAATPNAGDVARKATPTFLLDDRVGDVREKVLEVGTEVCIVANSEGIVPGRLKAVALSERPDATAEEAMELGPTTIRPNEPLVPVLDRMKRKGARTIAVTDLRGKLFGLLYRDDATQFGD